MPSLKVPTSYFPVSDSSDLWLETLFVLGPALHAFFTTSYLSYKAE